MRLNGCDATDGMFDLVFSRPQGDQPTPLPLLGHSMQESFSPAYIHSLLHLTCVSTLGQIRTVIRSMQACSLKCVLHCSTYI